MKLIREKPHRLPANYYLGRQGVAFTACVRHRVDLFIECPIIEVMRSLLYESAAHFNAEIIVYVFMPNHLHAVISSLTSEGDPLSAMKRFKQQSNYWLARHCPGIRWQKDFYDRIIRTPNELRRHVLYILNNPVRAGIVDSWKRYPHHGSQVFDIDSWDETGLY
jgi:REP element-mobilizing transposase RayT